MGKFSQIVQGTRARQTEVLPLVGARFDISAGAWVGPQDKVDLRALSEGEEIEVLREARAYAKAQGGDAIDEDAIYQHALRVFTLAKACVDCDSPAGAPTPYFDGGAAQIFASASLGPEHVVYVHEKYLLHRDEVSPYVSEFSPEGFLEVTTGIARGDQNYFLGLRQGMLWNFTRTLAFLHLHSLGRSSSLGDLYSPLPKIATHLSTRTATAAPGAVDVDLSAVDEPGSVGPDDTNPHTLRGP